VSAVVFRESKDEGSQSQGKANTRDSTVEAVRDILGSPQGSPKLGATIKW